MIRSECLLEDMKLGVVDGGPDLPDDAPDEEAVVAHRSPLGHLGHAQVQVHPVAEEFSFATLKSCFETLLRKDLVF